MVPPVAGPLMPRAGDRRDQPRVVPGDPALAWAGPHASPQQLAKARVELGLNDPFWTQIGPAVQVQSTWFPLYDRNPQKFVPNIMFAQPEDYTKATQRIWHTPGNASSIASG